METREDAAGSTARGPGPRPWWRKAALGLITVALLLGLLEAALWALGAPTGAGGRDPFVGFASSIPHFAESGGTVRRPDARRTVMNPFEFAAEKSEGTLRVFCVGGSTTYGRPYFDATSFAGFLRAMLAAGSGGPRVEVVNAGAISYASYRVSGVMREAAAYEPDIFVIYTGHNEFLERRTYEDIRRLPEWLRDASGLVSRTRTGTLLRRLLAPAGGGPQGLGDDVARVAANAIGPDAFHRDDAWRRKVVAEFRLALHGMIDIAEDAAAQTVLLVPAADVADWSPWGSQASDALAVNDVGRFLARLRDAREAVARGAPQDAEAAARDCVTMDPRHAEAWYLLGRALRETGRSDEAAGALRRALEEDVVPLRAIAALQQAVRDVGAERGVIVIDFERLLTPRPGAGVPGDESFADHVHPWPKANLLLARAIADALAQRGALRGTTWDRVAAAAAAERHLAGADPLPRARELLRLAFVLGSFERYEMARERCERAATLLGGDAAALSAAARALESCKDTVGALDFARRAVAADDASATAHTRLGVGLLGAGDTAAARAALRRAIELDPDAVEAHAQLGALLANDGDLGGAEEQFREVLRLRPGAADSHYNVGLVLARRGRRGEAEAAFRNALGIDPAHADARKQLDGLLR